MKGKSLGFWKRLFINLFTKNKVKDIGGSYVRSHEENKGQYFRKSN